MKSLIATYWPDATVAALVVTFLGGFILAFVYGYGTLAYVLMVIPLAIIMAG